jgi:succinate dehydrogenase/fumarate reductase flavoprotein subunit
MTASTILCDVLVVGSGAGGLSAALSAAEAGLDVVVIEKAPLFGGTTARSEGMIWVPMSRQARDASKDDSAMAALTYLGAVAGNHLDRAKSASYLAAAPGMLEFMQRQSRIRYALASSLDYASESPGATAGTRSLSVQPMDGRTFGKIFDQVRPPLRSTLAFGGMTVTSGDFPHVLKAHRSLASFAHMAKMTLAYARDRLSGYSRGTRIGGGHALIACLVEALTNRKVRLMRETMLDQLAFEAGCVVGAAVSSPAGPLQIAVRRGVVLAAGGFSGDEALRRLLYPHAGRGHGLLAAETSAGDGLRAGQAVGAALHQTLSQPAAWTPASMVPQVDGSKVAFPHYVDRNKPGFIAVDHSGQRFANEAAVYHAFVPSMIEAGRGTPSVECWLIADAKAVGRYGIGATPPFPGFARRAVRRGYLVKAASAASLAHKIGVPAEALAATIERFNSFARSGLDADFHRGETAYERACGDPANSPNPSLGTLETPPFYAVKLVPSDIGTFAGLKTDERARVLRADGSVIAGLYAVGNDAANAFGGTYPAAGVTVGLALTFGYIAGRELAELPSGDI